MLGDMRCRYLVLGLLLSASVASANTPTAPIIGGTQATLGQYPTVVAVVYPNGICTGTIVDKDWILTAAHCVSPGVLGYSTQQQVTDNVRVYYNTININTSAGRANVRRAATTIPKASFNINALGSNDIGLIKLATPITDIAPSPVNLDPAMAPVGIVVTQVGFGSTSGTTGGTVGVEYVVTPRTSTSCSSIGAGDNVNLLCFNQQDGKGKCEGDSGGPSFAMINNKLTVVGVTSFGDQNCSIFGADTRTDVEKTFLLTNAPQLEAKCTMDSECNGGICFQGQCLIQPFQPMGLGSECTSGANCESGLCANGPGGMKCTMTCTPNTDGACPDGLECLDAGGTGACWPASDDSGCCDASGKGAPTALLASIGFGLLLLRRRRR